MKLLSLLRTLSTTALGLSLSLAAAQAGSATWNLNPVSGNWRNAGNWTPATVPNSLTDVATFGVSNTTDIELKPRNLLVAEIDFQPGASAYTFSLDKQTIWSVAGAGIVNNSGIIQNFVNTAPTTPSEVTLLQFGGSASAGSQTAFTVEGGSGSGAPGQISFIDQANAGNAVFVCKGSTGPTFTYGGEVSFGGSATAASATLMLEGGAGAGGAGGSLSFGGNFATPTAANANITAEGSSVANASGSFVNFLTSATAGSATMVANGGQAEGPFGGASIIFTGLCSAENATFTINGALVEGATGAKLIFQNGANAANGTCIINGGAGNLAGGQLTFADNGGGGTSRFEVFGNGSVNLSSHSAPGLTIGSLEGDGLVLLGKNNLTIGGTNLSTTFAGTLQGDAGSSFTKAGTGTLTFNGSSTIPGVTTVAAGTLGGNGTFTGALTIGTGSGGGAVLAPAAGGPMPMTLITQSALTFKADGSYTCTLSTKRAQADQVGALGVTIDSAAQFKLQTLAKKRLAMGQTFVVLNNTAATPIQGTFSNLADGTTLNSGNNKFQASYEGGDGNDLTLTVQ